MPQKILVPLPWRVLVVCALLAACGQTPPEGPVDAGQSDAGVALLPLGSACAAGGECVSGACADGVCCEGACTGTCEACVARHTGAADGRCAPVLGGSDPDDECQDLGEASCGTNGTCDGHRACALHPADTECAAASCAEGVRQLARSCDGAGTCVPGESVECAPFACAGSRCANDCTSSAQCAPGRWCDEGTGRCEPTRGPGEDCGADEACASGHCTDGICCDRACTADCESCDVAGSVGTCAAVVSGTPDGACTGERACGADGACLQVLGTACTSDDACGSGHCVDGVCCESACTGACVACSAAKKGEGTSGTCGPMAAGTDLDGDCDDQGAASCGLDGSCDGAGACRYYSGATACRGASCAGTTFSPADQCNGTGSCLDSGTQSCGAYACGTGACLTSCTGDGDCADGHWCSDGSCVARLAIGAACVTDGSCSSGSCVDGVCCSSACEGACLACSALKKGAGSDGTCGPVRAGSDPEGDCADEGAASCGLDGSCDGAGTCRYYAGATECRAASCAGTTFSPADRCNGAGSCVDSGTQSCGAYACGDGACRTSCTGDGDCASGYRCSAGSCVAKLAIGAACITNVSCSSGSCVDGVCCNAACNGTCVACSAMKKGSGFDGMCGPIAAGFDPDNECLDEGPTSCGFDGSCNGAGACRRYSSGTGCGP